MKGAKRVMRRTTYNPAILLASALSLAACGAAIPTAASTSTTTTSTTTTTTAPPKPTTTKVVSTPASPAFSIVQSPAISGPAVLNGNGIGNAIFGQPQATAIANLEKVLGPPNTAAPRPTTNCTVDAYLKFLGLTADFDHGRFVGYSTGSLLGMNRQILNSQTAKGLRIGDTLAYAKQIYGSELRTSLAQGGSWFASTPSGTLAGLTTEEVNSTSPAPRIADISAGSVGCPAVSP
ncbi:MAG: hypothetical protein EPN30_05245 [Actinomycetota bacterium]|nr:MAG: hypothetical protein EPN30_05245 [Actinomycetota bacterium]